MKQKKVISFVIILWNNKKSYILIVNICIIAKKKKGLKILISLIERLPGL